MHHRGDLRVPGSERCDGRIVMGSPTGGPRIDKGLDDIFVKETRICFVDGTTGRLLYAGYDIRDLAAHSTFEETTYLLWHGRLPSREQLTPFSAEPARSEEHTSEFQSRLHI